MVTTTTFLSRVKAAALVPTHQITYTDADILDLANEEMDNLIIPKIISLREDFFVTRTDVDVLTGVDTLEIPERAVGRTIREIKLLQTTSTRPYSLYRESITNDFAFSTEAGLPKYHYFQGDQIKISPVPDQDYGVYQLFWEIRPSRLVTTTDVGIITSVSSTSVTVQQNLNSAITTNAIVDLVKATAGYSPVYIDKVIGSISTGLGPKVATITGFSVSDPITGIVAGDRLTLAFESDVIQMPDEAVACLVQATALRIVNNLATADQVSYIEKLLARNLDSLNRSLAPRNEAASFKIRPKSPAFGPGRTFSILGTSTG